MPEYKEQRDRIFPTPSELNDSGLMMILSLLEGRHLATNDAVRRVGKGPILELSAGLSSRGLEFSGRQYYIETDLPEMTALKKKIVNRITPEHAQYHLQPLNPLHLSEFLEFGKHLPQEFREQPITILNEGLMMYLSRAEQEQLRDNIAFFLKAYSPEGRWISTDLSSRPTKEDDKTAMSVMERIEKETGRVFNRFKDDKQVHEFLDDGNLEGESLPNGHLIDTLSLEKLKITHKEAVSVSHRWRAWNVTLK